MKKRPVFTVVVPNEYPVSLAQQGNKLFTVAYGADVKTDLHYQHACIQLGSAILHALACAGQINNEGP